MNRLNFASLRHTVCLYGNVFGIVMFLSTRLKQTHLQMGEKSQEKREDMVDDARQG